MIADCLPPGGKQMLPIRRVLSVTGRLVMAIGTVQSATVAANDGPTLLIQSPFAMRSPGTTIADVPELERAGSLVLVRSTRVSARAPACPPCSLELIHVVRLGSSSDPVARSTRMNIAQLRSGGFVLHAMLQAPQLARYSESGAFIRVYERAGRGPGELTAPLGPMTVLGDTLFVAAEDRLIGFDLELSHLHTRRLNVPPNDVVLLGAGRGVIAYPLWQRGSYGLAHLIDGDGRVTYTIETAANRGAPMDDYRHLAPSWDGGFWVAPMNDNWLHKYSPSGELELALRVDRPWLVPWRGTVVGEGALVRPRPRVTGIREYAPGRLLVTAFVADSGWVRREREDPLTASDDRNAMYDTIIEIVDAGTGKILASLRDPLALRLLRASNDMLFAAVESEDGDIHAVVYRALVTTK